MVKSLTFLERVEIVKYADAHGASQAASHFRIAETQVKAWLAFERGGRLKFYDPAYKQPEITEELLDNIFIDLNNNGLSLLQLCIKYGFKNTDNLSAILKKARSGKPLLARRGRPPKDPRPQDSDPLDEKLPGLRLGATRQELEKCAGSRRIYSRYTGRSANAVPNS